MIGAIPERLLTADEVVLEEFHPHWRILLPSAFLGIAAVLVTAVAIGSHGLWVAPLLISIWGATLLVFAVEAVKRLSTTYTLTTHRLIWRWGLLRRQGMETPLEQINTVQFSQNVLERALGFGDLEIESASQNGTSKFADIPEPQAFQARVYAARNERARYLRGGHHHHQPDPQPAPTPPPQQQPQQRSQISELAQLAEMHDTGQLTDAEFTAAKARLLGLG